MTKADLLKLLANMPDDTLIFVDGSAAVRAEPETYVAPTFEQYVEWRRKTQLRSEKLTDFGLKRDWNRSSITSWHSYGYEETSKHFKKVQVLNISTEAYSWNAQGSL